MLKSVGSFVKVLFKEEFLHKCVQQNELVKKYSLF